jgi:iron-sulfur cluster repair protein YtfE (RIC family)
MADHEILSQYVEHFNQIFGDESSEDIRKEIDEIKLILNEKVVDHFAYEEEHIFPGLLEAISGKGVSDVVSILRKEHVLLLKQAKRLNEMLSDEEADGTCTGELRKAMLDFLGDLDRHASKENELFPSLM